MTPAEQLLQLQRRRRTSPAFWLKWALLAGAAVLIAVAAWRREPAWALLALAAVLGAYWPSRAMPHAANAATAAEIGERRMGRLAVSVTGQGPAQRFFAVVAVDMLSEWGFEFRPEGWRPEPGQFMAELCFLSTLEWPALVLAERGILYPHSAPVRRIPR